MLKRILLSGLLGWIVMLVWTAVTNIMFGFTLRVEMNQVADEPRLYQVLKETVVTPGAYIVNPALTPQGQFPAGEPVFSVRYSGFGHEAAGRLVYTEPLRALVVALLAACLLAATSRRVLASYARKFLFVVGLGILLAVFGDLSRYGIGGYPFGSAFLIAANHVVMWALAGLVMAATMRARAE